MTDTRLAYIDQGSFMGLRALGHQPYFQGVWFYDRQVDFAGLTRLNENLMRTLLGRLIDPSPLPFGRHRWVRADRVSRILIEQNPRDRSGVYEWLESLAESNPIDPEHGPGWQIAVLPLTDGGSVVTILAPHALGDGLGKLQAFADAAVGRSRGPQYPARDTTARIQRFFADLGLTIREIPSVVRAVAAAAKASRTIATKPPKQAKKRAAPATPHPESEFRDVVFSLEQEVWDAAAKSLGGTSNSLMQAFAVCLAERLGRFGPDGQVRLAIPVSVRTDDDTRANALDSITVAVDPEALRTDLAPLRAATKAALAALASNSHALMGALALTPFIPKFAIRRTEAIAMGVHDVPVGCSNYGPMFPELMLIDGADAQSFVARVVEPGMTPQDYERIGGSLYVLSGRILGRIFLTVNAFVVGEALTQQQLAEHVLAVLAEFSMPEPVRVF